MFFLSRFARRFGRPVETISADTMDRLVGYAWPGNIRELQNVIERAVVLSRGPALELDRELLPPPARPAPGGAPDARGPVDSDQPPASGPAPALASRE